jgi:trehalose/maltose hydrolase-like predicted phosphorylase
MQNQWSGYTFGAAGPPSVTTEAPRPAGGAVDGFLLAYEGFDPEAEGLREALTSTGNGYLCARRGGVEDADGVHDPGTYVHGGYNRETTILGGLPVLNEDLVNLPNWLVLQLRIEGGDVIRARRRGAARLPP